MYTNKVVENKWDVDMTLSPIIARYTNESGVAKEYFDQALIDRRNGQYGAALAHFDDALMYLYECGKYNTEPYDIQHDVGLQLQGMRTQREQGLTYAYRAMQTDNIDDIDHGGRVVSRAIERSAKLIIKIASAEIPKCIEKELWSEHGMNISYLGRLANARDVLLDEYIGMPVYYATAHVFLKLGNNGYNLCNNAVNAFRSALFEDCGKIEAWKWLKRIQISRAYTFMFDHENYAVAADLIRGNMITLKSSTSLNESIRLNP